MLSRADLSFNERRKNEAANLMMWASKFRKWAAEGITPKGYLDEAEKCEKKAEKLLESLRSDH